MERPEDSARVVGVSVCDSAPLLWRVQDLRSVRRRGLVGALLGSLPRSPRQNCRMGRPLLLLPEEERLLTESCATAADMPAPRQDVAQLEQQLRRHEEEQQKSFEEQSMLALEDRRTSLLRAMTSGSPPEAGDIDESLQRRLDDLECSFVFPHSALVVQLSTARAGLGYCPEARAFLQAEQPIRGGHNELSRDTKYQVFRDLRAQGFYMTSAGKFGGDFLVYPGDPLRFHAHFIALCLAEDEAMNLLDILAVARLGSNVKKTVLLCSPTADGAVTYTSLQWSGMA